ncbi:MULTISPECIES: site-specific DNA-methyltransferase [Enterobacteriaceae]|uniref:site-specific DNA-methyltransferase (adenine-specific) n=1 Tax=Salmonella enteritidis TaxID=149539 RepID=A0A3E1X993_SALEN|nr:MULTISPECIES: site-specific DNA-methyltransferase [Enterobacteriaceae]ECT9468830.1 site-specific DNA-methyltransferase [Salmonella enterica subsp. enterica serovar Carrau]EKY3090581.1 site-specific DNA-methyltransferase [Cronobacter dublinensis]HBC8786655.1 site-specific DNA-methyltransferase [Citrobacter braakii]ATT16739.1 site-specific DNA-methyltransferase [Salmonella enterica subsp. enterica serovar Enteritidis]AWP42555.1 site-specific DNA-methyltransferase [Salmonella enterica subsp. e
MIKITSDMPELQSMNITEENISKLKSLFPEAFNEGNIDFDVLKQLLGENVDEKEERYGLNWHGKRQARQLALTPSRGTLRPCKDESVDWDNTKNIMIEGDNLEVLKLLQKSHAGKVKLIYIDPPYNTGKDFVYPDNFQDNMKNYLEITGQTEDGVRISSNSETSGRYHTDWLNMMYPRIKLARNLLKEDGFIFLSIDDNEVNNLKLMCDDIFGQENFVANVIWQKKYSTKADSKNFSESHDYILCYKKSDQSKILGLPRSKQQESTYKNLDNDPRGVWASDNLLRTEVRDYAVFGITSPSGMEHYPPAGSSWRFNKDKIEELISDNRIWFGEDGNNKPRLKRFRSEVRDTIPPQTLWGFEHVGHTDEGTKQLAELFDSTRSPFPNPKPVRLLQRIVQIATKENDIIMDFFAGSGTTGQAVYELNETDKQDRKFILVQLPETLSKSNKEDLSAIYFCEELDKPLYLSELTKERLRRAGNKVKAINPDWNGDTGFRVFKLDTSNIRPWEARAETLSEQLDAYVSPILEGRSEEDLLTELMLKRGIDLSVNIETRQFDGLTVSSVEGGKLFTCFASQIPVSSVEGLTKGIIDWHKSLKAGKDTVCYFLDDAFENNVAKTNLCAILEQHGLTNLHSL